MSAKTRGITYIDNHVQKVDANYALELVNNDKNAFNNCVLSRVPLYLLTILSTTLGLSCLTK